MSHKIRKRKELPALTEPAYSNEESIVENVYSGRGHDRDRTSQRRMENYLKQRLVPRIMGSRAVTVMVPDGHKNRFSLKRDGWVFSPRKAAVASLIGLGVLNGAANADEIGHNISTAADDVMDEVGQVRFALQHGEGTPDRLIVERPAEYETSTIRGVIDGNTQSEVARTEANEQAINEIVREIESDPLYIDGMLVSISVSGETSDEFRGDDSLSTENPENEQLGLERAQNVAESLETILEKSGINHPPVEVVQREALLSDSERDRIISLAEDAGFESAQQAINAYDSGATLPDELAASIRESIVSKRGTIVEAIIEAKSMEITPGELRVEPGIHPPEDPDRDYEGLEFYPFAIPPIPRLRLAKEKIAKGRPVTFMERGTPTWVHLYEEALNEDGQLKNDVAWYTRKMNHLLRDDRIKAVDVATIIGRDEMHRSIRTCFVDHEPTDEVLEKFREIMKVFARANDGTLPDNISTIMVYPSENAGVLHQDPKKIGLGIDEQYDASILGTTTPLLGLIEMHMPESPTEDDMKRYMGALWTYAHEMTHGVDISSKPQRLVPLLDGSYVSVNTWRDAAGSVHQNLLPVEGEDTLGEVKFEIQRELRDRKGNIRIITEVVDADDPKLEEAVSSRIIGRMPTQYGSTMSSEHFAEAGAAVVSGIDIPYSEAGVYVDLPEGYDFASGYQPAKESEDTFFDATGIQSIDARLQNPWVTFRLHAVDEDPSLYEIRKRALSTVVPRERNPKTNEREMVEVLAWVID